MYLLAVGVIQGKTAGVGCFALAGTVCRLQAVFFTARALHILPSDQHGRTLVTRSTCTPTDTTTAASRMPPPNTHGVVRAIPPVMHEGWVLKKRRKKMQGTEVSLSAFAVH